MGFRCRHSCAPFRERQLRHQGVTPFSTPAAETSP